MDTLELSDSLNIVFEKEQSDLKKGTQTCYVDQISLEKVLKYPNAETVIDLFATINNETVKSYFLDTLKKCVSLSDEIYLYSYGGFMLAFLPFVFTY